MAMNDCTVRLHRVLRCPPARVYRAFTEADAMAKWLPGRMGVTVTLKPVACGTDLGAEQSGIPEAIPLEMCCLGWQESLAQRAALAEPAIPG
jgi:uncharacterized protein YndB with AHSA1/START domain